MNLPERFAPDDPREWLNRARSNLALANSRISGAYLEDLCFDAQQAAEKAIKAVMIARDIDFPYMHDLGSLLTLLEENGETIPEAGRSRGDVAHHIRHHYSLPQCRQPRRGARVSGSDCHRRRSGPMGGGAIVIVPGHERRPASRRRRHPGPRSHRRLQARGGHRRVHLRDPCRRWWRWTRTPARSRSSTMCCSRTAGGA